MANETKVTRMTAKDAEKKAPKKNLTKKAAKKPKAKKEPTNPFTKALFGIGGYFKGAWFELRQVRWPSRRATWGLTFAVLLFTAFFVVIIVLLDLAFQSLFELIIG